MNRRGPIIIASDHAGFSLKSAIVKHLHEAGYEVVDVGTHSDDRTDYPDHAHRAAEELLAKDGATGVLVCGSGNGVNMVANKHAGIRSALVWNQEIAELAKQHNNANMIALPARFIKTDDAISIVMTFLGAEFEGGRHEGRVSKIDLQQEIATK